MNLSTDMAFRKLVHGVGINAGIEFRLEIVWALRLHCTCFIFIVDLANNVNMNMTEYAHCWQLSSSWAVNRWPDSTYLKTTAEYERNCIKWMVFAASA